MKRYTITIRKAGQHSYYVYFDKSKNIGKFIQDVDGFYYYHPKLKGGGLWSEHTMRMIADKLKNLNKPWNDYIEKNLNDKDL